MVHKNCARLIIAVLFAVAGAAEARCKMPPRLDALIITMQLALINDGLVSGADAARLEVISASIDVNQFALTLKGSSVTNATGVFLGVVGAAATIGAAGRIEDPVRLQTRLNEAMKVMAALCKERFEMIIQRVHASAKTPKRLAYATPARHFFEGSETYGGMSFTSLIFLIPFVFVFVYFLFAGRRAYHWVHARAFSRRSCRIAATLEQGLDIFDGHITLLDRRACGFQPADQTDYAWIARLANMQEATIIVGHHSFGCRVDGFHDDFVTCFFHRRLKKELVELLLQFSSTPTRYVRGPAPSVASVHNVRRGASLLRTPQ